MLCVDRIYVYFKKKIFLILDNSKVLTNGKYWRGDYKAVLAVGFFTYADNTTQTFIYPKVVWGNWWPFQKINKSYYLLEFWAAIFDSNQFQESNTTKSHIGDHQVKLRK